MKPTRGWTRWEVDPSGDLRAPGAEVRLDGDRGRAGTRHDGHEIPGATCICGFSAHDDPAHAGFGSVLGVIEQSGRVVEDSWGQRRSARARCLFLLAGNELDPARREAVERQHGVPVHATGIPINRLTRFLSDERQLADALRRHPEQTAELDRQLPRWQNKASIERTEEDFGIADRRRALARFRRTGSVRRESAVLTGRLCVLPLLLLALLGVVTRLAASEVNLLTISALLVLGAVAAFSMLPALERIDALTVERPPVLIKGTVLVLVVVAAVPTYRLTTTGAGPETALIVPLVGLVAAIVYGVVARAKAGGHPDNSHGRAG